MSNSSRDEFRGTTECKLTVETQPRLFKVQSFGIAMSNLRRRLLTNVTDLSILQHITHLKHIQSDTKPNQLKTYRYKLHKLLKGN